jgi:CheY-like chemotaxis protein
MRNAAKILIVDDDKSSSQLLSEVVKRMGLKPIVANKPIDALNVVKLQTVHAALVDVLLPKMSGVDLVAEFRKTKFGDNPVVLVSGVFKDKNFATDALKKTGAVDFLFKPFGVEELIATLQAAFKDAINVEKWNVQALLTRKMPSARDRSKALEHLESITGNDFPFVLGLLLEVSISGHLNIVNEGGEIFGATVTKGTITDVDSTESQSAGVLALISKGFLHQQDWEEFQRGGNNKFTLERLVQEGYVSPHGVTMAKHEQILADLKAICSAEQLKLNFGAAETQDSPPKHAVELNQLLSAIFGSEEFFNSDYLKTFYSAVVGSSVQLVAAPETLEQRWKDPVFAGMDQLLATVKAGGTISEVIAAQPDKADAVLRAVHFLVLHRDIAFADVERVKDVTANRERYTKMYEELAKRTPDQIFEYFGAPPMASVKVVESLFEQYSKSNDPNKLSPELKDISQKCFDLVKDARATMIDEGLRMELIEKKKSAGASAHKKANELVAKGLDQLRRGQAAKAVELLSEADQLHPTTLGFLIGVWAGIKSGISRDKAKLMESMKKLDALSSEDRQSAYYFMAMGLVKKALLDQTAVTFFEKAVEADSTFTEARRELTILESAAKDKEKSGKVDLLTGDITQVISQLFRKKAD